MKLLAFLLILAGCGLARNLSFEQTGRTRYTVRATRGTIHLTPGGLEIRTAATASAPIRITPVGASPSAPEGEDRLPGTTTYILGHNPPVSHANYARVRYAAIYPGVDLLYYGNNQQLEYDLVLAPRANPRDIRFRLEGLRRIALTPDGQLTAETATGDPFTLRAPVAFQDRRAVEARFTLQHGNQLGFRLGAYDPNRPLTIDPVLIFSTFLGGSVSDRVNAMARDANGGIYVAGFTLSPDFPGATNNAANTIAFVTKLNPTATTILYTVYIGGTTYEAANGIAVDKQGNAYVVGQTRSADFPVTPSAFQPKLAGNSSSFVAKLNAQGTALFYATYLGGSSTPTLVCCDLANAVAVDNDGNAYVAGATAAFPTTPGAFQPNTRSRLATNAYVAKLNPTGTALVYSTYLGGSGQGVFNIGPAVFAGDQANGIAVDADGRAVVTGTANSFDFPITPGALQTANKAATTEGIVSIIPGANAFVTRFNAAGTALDFSTYLGGSGVALSFGVPNARKVYGDYGNAIALDPSGNIVVVGQAYSADFPTTPGAYQTKLRAVQQTTGQLDLSKIGSNAFLTRLDPTGSRILASTYLGGIGLDAANGVATDAAGRIALGGFTTSIDFPITAAAVQSFNKAVYASGVRTGFVAKFNPDATALLYGSFLGGTARPNQSVLFAGDSVTSVANDAGGFTIIAAGYTTSPDFPTTDGAVSNVDRAAGQTAFVAAVNPAGGSSLEPPILRANLGVVDAASYSAPPVPGSLAAIFGFNLAGTTKVTIDGISAPVLFAAANQVNIQVPWELEGRATVPFVVTTPNGNNFPATVTLGAAAPAVFTVNASGVGQAAVLNSRNQFAVAATPAARGEWVLIYCLGLGPVAHEPADGQPVSDASAIARKAVAVTIGGIAATINFAGLTPGYTGVYQVNAQVPASVEPGGQVALVVTVDGVSSKPVTIAVR